MKSSLSEPGFGWAIRTKEERVIIEEGRVLSLSDVQQGFPLDYPGEFVQEKVIKYGIDHHFPNFHLDINDVFYRYFASRNILNEYEEFLATGKSNGREMKWDMMLVQPNTSFRLHAHPNIELIYVIQGAMHEFRFKGQTPKEFTSSTDNVGPDLRSCNGKFSYLCAKARASDYESREKVNNEYIVNEKGSIHLSFTMDEGAALLVLWSGCHANVPIEFYPPKGSIPDIPVGVKPLHPEF